MSFFYFFFYSLVLAVSTVYRAVASPDLGTLPDNYFPVWRDSPDVDPGHHNWYDLIELAGGQNGTLPGLTFTSTDGAIIDVNNGQGKGAIHLFANPKFLQTYDDRIRRFSGPSAQNRSGTTDRCGWPRTTADSTPQSSQHSRRAVPMREDFSKGFRPENLVVGLRKGCCDTDKYAKNPYHRNINVVRDLVNGVEKSVLALTARNADNADSCPGPNCHKDVTSTGTVTTAGIFASGRYEVVAKVPKASGLVWAIWTFHYEEHLPSDCSDFSCWCANMPSTEVMLEDACEFRADGSGRPCKFATVCDGNTDGWDPTPPPPAPIMTPKQCGQQHASVGPDPQFIRNSTFGGWVTTVNHEIDIEIPANCVNTPNVCNEPVPGVPGALSCIDRYDTANLNNYIYTQNSGSGPAYANMCVAGKDGAGTPMQLLGDGQYHNYSFSWHTGSKTQLGRVDFYIDGVYMGTNNAFVPTRGSRFWISHWYPASKNAIWNGRPNDWGGGSAGDGKTYNMTTLISEVNVIPFNEPNDIMYPSPTDKPDGCADPHYNQRYPVCHSDWSAVTIPPTIV